MCEIEVAGGSGDVGNKSELSPSADSTKVDEAEGHSPAMGNDSEIVLPAQHELRGQMSSCWFDGFIQLLRGVAANILRPPRYLRLRGDKEEFDTLYTTVEKLGKGSFGEVYACQRLGKIVSRLHDERSLCVKISPLRCRHGTNRMGKISEQEKKELVNLTCRLVHPNVVRHYSFMESSDTWYVLMERCEGPELREHIDASGGLLAVEDVQSVARQILSAISAVHALRIMHRDIKPENFRFSDQSAKTLKLLDFGAAKRCCEGPSREIHTVTGTLLFVAPEVFDCQYWYACDCWSAGIVLFFLISGQLPFETSDVTMLRSMHRDPVLTGDCLFRGARWKQVQAAARMLIRGLLAVDPKERLTAAAAAQNAWVQGDDAEAASSIPAPLSRSPSSSVALNELKRSLFNWDLAAYAGDDNSEDHDGASTTFSRNASGELDHGASAPRPLAAARVVASLSAP